MECSLVALSLSYTMPTLAPLFALALFFPLLLSPLLTTELTLTQCTTLRIQCAPRPSLSLSPSLGDAATVVSAFREVCCDFGLVRRWDSVEGSTC